MPDHSQPASDSAHAPQLGVAIPLANEEDSVEALLEAITRYLQPGDAVFCVLDRASKDNTRSLVEAAAEKDPRIRVVWTPENRCVVDAYFAGYRAALQAGCDWVLEMDGGFSHRPDQIPEFRARMSEGYDYVGGSRFLPGGCHDSPFTRRFVSWCGSRLASSVLRAPMTDMTSGFQLYRRHVLQEVVDRGVVSRANFFQTEIRLRMLKHRWTEIPIRYSNTNYTIGRSSIREALRNLWKLRQAQKHGRDTIDD